MTFEEELKALIDRYRVAEGAATLIDALSDAIVMLENEDNDLDPPGED